MIRRDKSCNKSGLTPRQALKEIQSLKYYFIGDRKQLESKIDEIISKVK